MPSIAREMYVEFVLAETVILSHRQLPSHVSTRLESYVASAMFIVDLGVRLDADEAWLRPHFQIVLGRRSAVYDRVVHSGRTQDCTRSERRLG